MEVLGYRFWVHIFAFFVQAILLRSNGVLGAVPATFIFGDSLSDVGNNNHLQYALAKANFPWYGVDYKGGVPTGRFTNGRTIGDIIGEKLGLPIPPAYLSLSPGDDRVLQGVNYASGGGGILNETGFLFIQRLSLATQINYFQATKAAMVKRVGAAQAEKLCNEALFFVGIGSNDYINNFLLPFSADAQKFTVDGFNEHLVNTLSGHLVRLHSLGARKIIFHGLAPLGCIPSQRTKSGVGNKTICLEGLNSWISQLNNGVKTLLEKLDKELHGASITFIDTYAIVEKLVHNPKAYGFNVSDSPCCDVSTSLGQLCLPNSNLCSKRENYVFWDAFHPTDAANIVIADHVLSHPKLLQYIPASAPAHSPSPSPSPSPSTVFHHRHALSPAPSRA